MKILQQLALLFIMTTGTLNAKVIESCRIAEVMPLIDRDTWFLVDLDNTLYEGALAFGHAHWFYDQLQQTMKTGTSRDDALRQLYPTWVKSQSICPVKPIEEEFISSILQLQQRGIVVMGLTHRQPPVADPTIGQVASLGLDFLKTAPCQDTFCVSAKSPTLYTHGILFVSDFNRKYDVLIAFLERTGAKPKKVVFIDDKKKNVDELEALEKHGINYIGIHYTAIEKKMPVYHPQIARLQHFLMSQILEY